MNTVLITAIGSFSADATIMSLKTHGFRVVGCDIYPKEWVVNAYSVDVFFQVPLGTEQEQYINALKNICSNCGVDYIIPLTDAEIDTLNDNRMWFHENGVQICISSKETIDICRDKYQTYQALKNQDLRVRMIPTIRASNYDEYSFQAFPMVCKPYNGRSSQGLLKILCKDELQFHLEAVNPEDYILQPLITGRIITVDIARNQDTGRVTCVPRKELLRTLNGAGTSVYVFHDEMLSEECRKIANCLGVRGCVNFEFIQSQDGVYHFLECNPRFSGGVKFSCMVGYDFIRAHINCFSGNDIDNLEPYQNCYIARKYEETITSIG